MVEKNKPKHPLRIILDTPTLKNKYSETIQSYDDNDFFEFISVGSSSKFTELKIDSKNKSLVLEKDYRGKLLQEGWHFPYTEEVINALAEERDLKPEEVQLIYVAKTIASDRDVKAILVTERRKLINFKKYLPDNLPEFTIFSPEEAKIFIDLFCKRHGAYFLKSQYFANKGLWYLYSMKSKLQRFQLIWSINAYSETSNDKEVLMMGSISKRMQDMLKAIDEIGMHYYKGSNNDTMGDMLYHLNYWIALYSGILDALAWISIYRYAIPAPNKNKVSIRDKDVLSEIYKRNPKLRELLNKNQKIINLVYEPRNIFIHREMLSGLGLSVQQTNTNLNMIRVEGEFLTHIRDLQPIVARGMNKAGLYDLGDAYLLEPYRFVKFATKEYVRFLNQYVIALDYEDLLAKDPSLKKKIEDATKAVLPNFNFDPSEFEHTALGY